jgi:bifunctional non-homologous end joining protein LigD
VAIGVKAPFPGFIEPALVTSIEKVPSGERWIHEIKFNGYRAQVHLANEAIQILSRSGHDWTKRFGKAANAWRRSSTARSSCPPPTAPPISRSCRTS